MVSAAAVVRVRLQSTFLKYVPIAMLMCPSSFDESDTNSAHDILYSFWRRSVGKGNGPLILSPGSDGQWPLARQWLPLLESLSV